MLENLWTAPKKIPMRLACEWDDIRNQNDNNAYLVPLLRVIITLGFKQDYYYFGLLLLSVVNRIIFISGYYNFGLLIRCVSDKLPKFCHRLCNLVEKSSIQLKNFLPYRIRFIIIRFLKLY